MRQLIKGETVILTVKVYNSDDEFGQPVYDETYVNVNNVCVGSPSSDDVISEMSLSGKRIAYTLGIPKDDTNDWTNTSVEIRSKMYRTIGIPTEYTEGSMPDWWPWNKSIKVEAYE